MSAYSHVLSFSYTYIFFQISSEQKHRYAQLILKERANKRKLLEIIREFSLVCAGMAISEDMNKVMAAWDRIDSKQCAGLPD